MNKTVTHRTTLSAPLQFAWHGWFGLLLIASMWPLNWSLEGLRTHILFFPLWLGYCLVVDALCLRRTGTSILTRSPRDYVMLFLVSAPAWWLFEIINWRTQNWEYLARNQFTNLGYFTFASVCFSTVMPAVFGTAELMRSTGMIERFRHGPRVPNTQRSRLLFLVLGVTMLALLLIWPRYCFPFMWMSLFFILEPINAWLGRRSIWDTVAHGDWSTVAALWSGSLVCGFFWEMWNFYAYPKWVYHVPFVDFLYIFEMPLLGYLGYLPFALELYALIHLVQRRTPSLRV